MADFDGDTVPDVVTASLGTDDVSLLLGKGDGTFQRPVSFPAGDAPFFVAAADLDGDIDVDLVIANSGSDDVSVLLNACGSTPRAPAVPMLSASARIALSVVLMAVAGLALARRVMQRSRQA